MNEVSHQDLVDTVGLLCAEAGAQADAIRAIQAILDGIVADQKQTTRRLKTILRLVKRRSGPDSDDWWRGGSEESQ